MKKRKRIVQWLALLAVGTVFMCTGCGGGGSGGASIPGARAQVARYVTNGAVYATAIGPDGTTYLGGRFTMAGPATGGGVPIDADTAAPVPSFPKVGGFLYAVAPDGSGGWYIGGNFSAVGGAKRNNLAHILADGSVDPLWTPEADGEIHALSVNGGTVYLGGTFSSITSNGTTATRDSLAAVGADGTISADWAPSANANGWHADVLTLAVSNNMVYAGGFFTSITSNGTTTTRNRLAAIGTDGTISAAWTPLPNATVQTLAVSNNMVYAGGFFTSITSNGTTTTRNYLAAIGADGTIDSWAPSANDAVQTLAVSNNMVYAGGSFTSITSNGTTTTRNRLAAIGTDGTLGSWAPSANSTTYALAVNGNMVYAGGNFTSITSNGTTTTRNGLAAIGTDGTLSGWNPSTDGSVRALAVNGNTVYAGGTFRSVGAVPRNRLAAIAPDGTLGSWAPSANSTVRTLAVSNNMVYAGGYFTSITSNGTTTTRNRLAAIGTDGTLGSWAPSTDNTVYTLAVSNNMVYAGGSFTSITSNGTTTTRNYLAAIGTDGTIDSWAPSANINVWTPYVNALAVSNGMVYAGGWFTSITSNGTTTTRNYLAAIGTDGTISSWAPASDNEVSALAVSNNMVYAGGYFTSITSNGTTATRNYLAAIGTDGTLSSWAPEIAGRARAVLTLAVGKGWVNAGGDFMGDGNFVRLQP